MAQHNYKVDEIVCCALVGLNGHEDHEITLTGVDNFVCTCDPATKRVVDDYMPMLVARYGFTMQTLTEENKQYIHDLLSKGELDEANATLSAWAYEDSTGN